MSENIVRRSKPVMFSLSVILFLVLLSEAGLCQVVINELLASNSNNISDPQDEYDDWIEIYNAGNEDFDIGGMYLTDDLSEPTKHRIPDNAPTETSIPAHSYLLFWADNSSEDGPLHLEFKLSSGGEEIGLFDTDGITLVDSITFDTQTTDISYGRYPDAGSNWFFFDSPTPGSTNNTPYLGKVEVPKFSHPRGFYDTTFSVTLTCETEAATICYTLDGSEPTETNGTVYTGAPIPISETTCLRAVAYNQDWLSSKVVSHTYLLNVSDAVKSLPVFSLVGDEQETFYKPNGIMAIEGGHYTGERWYADSPSDYNNPFRYNTNFNNPPLPKEAYERPVSLELINPNDNTGFQIDCGIRVHGSTLHQQKYRMGDDWFSDLSGYGWNWNKFSFKLYFRSIYGKAWLEYPLFERSPLNRIKRLVLRGGINDQINPFIIDELNRRLHTDMRNEASSGSIVNVFINGVYKGYFNPCEFVGEDFLREWYGSDNEWDVLTNPGMGYEIRDGDSVAFDALIDYARNHDLSMDAHYQEVASRLDILAFVDYLLLQLYSANYDWPCKWTTACERSNEGKFRFYLWDSEVAMEESGMLYQTAFNQWPIWHPGGGTGLNGEQSHIAWLYRALKANVNFRQLFCDRIQKHFYNDGVLMEANVVRRFNELHDKMSLVLPNMITFIRDTFAPIRPGVMLEACKEENLFTFEGPRFYINGEPKHGGYISAGDTLTLTNSRGSGTIYYTLDGSDPRLPASSQGSSIGEVSSNAIDYVSTGPIQLNETTHLMARVLDRSTWSALNEASFSIGAFSDNLRITEIMYHSPDPPDGASTEEFIELQNMGSTALNLNLVKFTNGVDFTFPNINLSPGEYVIVVKDQTAFAARYDTTGIKIAGQYTGSLNDGGETVELADAMNGTILSFRYNDSRGWSLVADGVGHSLVPLPSALADEPNGSLDYGGNWRASTYLGGSPGQADPTPIINVRLNEFMAHTDYDDPNPAIDSNDRIELYNESDTPVTLNDWYLSDSISDLKKWKIPDNTVVPALGWISFDEVTGFHHPVTEGFGLSKAGERILLSHLPGTAEDRVVDSVRFKGQEIEISLGRYPDGDPYWVTMLPTRSGANTQRVPSIVISELMYHPETGHILHDYIELFNPSSKVINLWNEIGVWRLDGGVVYEFPANTSIPANGSLLIVNFDPINTVALLDFRSVYGLVDESISLVGPFEGNLSNRGERVTLERPQQSDNPQAPADISWVIVDEVIYFDRSPWPSEPDGNGSSLHRTLVDRSGNDPSSWTADNPSPGEVFLANIANSLWLVY